MHIRSFASSLYAMLAATPLEVIRELISNNILGGRKLFFYILKLMKKHLCIKESHIVPAVLEFFWYKQT